MTIRDSPPKLARRLLLTFLRDELVEEVMGDLEEKFYATVQKKPVWRAQLNYWHQVFNYMRPFAVRKSRSVTSNQYDMLQNYLKIGLRNLLKSKLFSVINVSGMAISMAIFLVIALFVDDEFKFDKQVENSQLKFRVFNEYFDDDGSTKKGAMIPPMIAPTLAAEYPEVEYYTRYLNFNAPVLFEAGEKKFTEGFGGCADPGIFDMFSLKLLEGDRKTALKERNSVAINHTLKQKYFGDKPALGQSIEIFNENFKVVAVFENCSEHSHFQRNYFLAMDGVMPSDRMQSWGWNQFHTYLKLKPGTNVNNFEAKLKGFAQQHAWPITKPNGGYYIPHLMPVEKIHLYAYDQAWDIAVRGNVQTVYIFIGIAGFILLIAILNFVNLSTARAVSRLKEVGVRKVMGAFRRQLVVQFISESVVIVLIAVLIGCLITGLVLPYLNSFTEKHIPFDMFLQLRFVTALLAIAVFVGICAGIYPAFYISGLKPVEIYSNNYGRNSGKTTFRKGLVVFQFVLSFFLIIAAIIIREQHAYMRTTDLGFDKENLVVLQLRGDMTRNLETTKESFSNHPNILSATLGYGLPGEAYAGDNIIDQATGKNWHINMLTVDPDYINTLGLEIVAGRNFSKDILSDELHAFIVSETAAKMLGHPDVKDALEHDLAWNRWDAPDSLKKGKVIGVVKDIQLNSMREAMAPVILQVYPFGYSSLTMRVKPGDMPATIAHLEKTWKTFNAEWPFEYKFLDENFDTMYKAEEKLATLFTWFTAFAIFVACLGLFGLVVYSTTQKYKEISIRKVLGAKETGLVVMLAKDYMVLIGIAFIIAIPISYYAVWQWLQKFAFRIPITPMLFIRAGLFIMVISLLTVGIQSLKAARTNPINALKDE